MSDVMQRERSSDVTKRESTQPTERTRELVLRPPADIFEENDGITLLMDMPGVSKERLDVQADRNNLVVEGEVEIKTPEGMEALYADVRSTHYRRSFSLSGEQLDSDAVEASLKDGVLRIHIPKRAEHRPRKIEIKSA
jgi:HSP20 family protein